LREFFTKEVALEFDKFFNRVESTIMKESWKKNIYISEENEVTKRTLNIFDDISILSKFENSHKEFESFLDIFEPLNCTLNEWTRQIRYCATADDWRARPVVKDLRENQSQLEEIIEGYLIDKFSLSRSSTSIMKTCYRINKMINVLGLDEVSLLEIASRLPENIQAHALAAFVL
jgi:hypothetical protein